MNTATEDHRLANTRSESHCAQGILETYLFFYDDQTFNQRSLKIAKASRETSSIIVARRLVVSVLRPIFDQCRSRSIENES